MRRLASLVVLLIATCRAPMLTEPDAPSISLLAALDRSTVSCPSRAELQGVLAAPAANRVLFHDPMDAARLDAGWREGGELAGTSKERHAELVVDPQLAGPALLLPQGSAGLHRIVVAPGQTAVAVRARVRAIARSARPAALAVLSLDSIPAGADATQALLDVKRTHLASGVELRKSVVEVVATIEPERGDDWQELVAWLPAAPTRRALRISLIEEGGLLIDDVLVHHLRPCEELGQRRITQSDGDAPLLTETVELAGERMRSLLLPNATTLRMRVDVPARAPRLDLSTARHPLASSSAARVTIRIDGETIDGRDVGTDATADAFDAWRVPLDRFAGRSVELEFAAAGEPDSIAVLGDPWLLGAPARRNGPNVILLSIDTLRRDALGCYGERAVRTPAIDSLAGAGTCFTNATSPVSFTLPAHAAMMTGQHPLVHGMTDVTRVLDPDRSITLAERFAAQGWQTAAFTGGGLVHPDFGFGAGFARYSMRDPTGIVGRFGDAGPRLDETGAAFAAFAPVREWLRGRADQPFFLFLHTYFVHNYSPSDEFLHARGALRLREWIDGDDVDDRLARLAADPGAGVKLRRLYQAGVDEVDAHLVRPLLDELDALDLSDDTVIELVADHGEEFQEHQGLMHGMTLWPEVINVPMILRGPGIPRGVRRDDIARLRDVAPTLAARAGLRGDARCLGRDLFDPSGADDVPPRLLHLANSDERGSYRWDGLMTRQWTLLRQHVDDGVHRLLFDNELDPGEQHDVAAENPTRADELERLLVARIDELARTAAALPSHGDRPRRVDRDLERRLRELGYGEK